MGPKLVDLEVRFGHGRKPAHYVDAIHLDICEDFARLRKAGAKFNLRMVRQRAATILSNSTSPH